MLGKALRLRRRTDVTPGVSSQNVKARPKPGEDAASIVFILSPSRRRAGDEKLEMEPRTLPTPPHLALSETRISQDSIKVLR
jgi:hypothetical protein